VSAGRTFENRRGPPLPCGGPGGGSVRVPRVPVVRRPSARPPYGLPGGGHAGRAPESGPVPSPARGVDRAVRAVRGVTGHPAAQAGARVRAGRPTRSGAARRLPLHLQASKADARTLARSGCPLPSSGVPHGLPRRRLSTRGRNVPGARDTCPWCPGHPAAEAVRSGRAPRGRERIGGSSAMAPRAPSHRQGTGRRAVRTVGAPLDGGRTRTGRLAARQAVAALRRTDTGGAFRVHPPPVARQLRRRGPNTLLGSHRARPRAAGPP
jgi:hypothetical protein